MQPKQHEKHVGHLDGMLATSSLAGNRLRVATLVCRQAKMPLQTSIDASILQQMWVLSSANVCFVNLMFEAEVAGCFAMYNINAKQHLRFIWCCNPALHSLDTGTVLAMSTTEHFARCLIATAKCEIG